MERVRRKLKLAHDGDRQMVAILTAVLSDGLDVVEAACQEALDQNVSSAAVILNILARRRDPAPAVTILTPDALRLQHEPPRIVGDLLSAEIAEKQARSIKYQLTVAKLPMAKDIEDFDFDGTPVNETLIRDLANGTFTADQRNAVLIGGTGTGKSHLAIGIARALIRRP
jgi:DNA replication protein DnaC